ncbi:class I SAM-dependent methyltransferase [Thalassotalea piscium]
MSTVSKISTHYTHGDLLNTIEHALRQSGESLDTVTPEQLTSIDEFHIGGREATEHLFSHIPLLDNAKIADLGCGLGGTARYLTSHYQCDVFGIDVTNEYLKVGQIFNQKLGLSTHIKFLQASALTLPFIANSLDVITMLHVGMNIADKQQMFKEAYRCLGQGGYFLVYDVMRTSQAEIVYPLPWASSARDSHISTLEHYQTLLLNEGFEILAVNHRREFALQFFNQQATSIKTSGIKPILSLQTIIQNDAKIKFNHLINQIKSQVFEPIEIVAVKRMP